MTRAIIGFPRATPFFTYSGGSYVAGYPVTNLQTLPLSQVARSTSTSMTIRAASTTSRRVGMIGLARHNFSLVSTGRVRLYSDINWTTLAYDSGVVPIWPKVYPYSTVEWEDDQYWTSTYSDQELADTTWLWINWFDRDYMIGSLQIDVTDPTNTAGYVQAGFLEVAAQWQVGANFVFGSQYGYRFRSQVNEARGGAKYVDRQTKPRTFKGAITYAGRDEALAKHFERYRQLDFDEPFLWLPHPDEPLHWLRTSMLAQHVDPGPFTYAAAGRDTVPINLEEVIG